MKNHACRCVSLGEGGVCAANFTVVDLAMLQCQGPSDCSIYYTRQDHAGGRDQGRIRVP